MKRKINYTNSCFADETIVNDKKVIYGVVALYNYPPISVAELKRFVKANISLVKREWEREKFLTELKSRFFVITDTVGFVKKLVNKAEIRWFKKFSSKEMPTELQNREVALTKLIKSVQCKYIYIDDYPNAPHRKKMIALAKKENKILIFCKSEEVEGIQLADVLLKLFKQVL